MPSRATPLVTGQLYHIYNRGNEKRPIFKDRTDFKRFIRALAYYQLAGPKPKLSHLSENYRLDRSKKIVEILAYCLMPNHFHLLVKQLKDGGITEFISKLSNSYTKYYNIRHRRSGYLLQGEFKSVIIENDEQLVHVSRYIHLNPIASFLVRDLEEYPWSSYIEYIHNSLGLTVKEQILDYFSSTKNYQQFVLDQVDYSQTLEAVKHQLLDED